MNCNNIRDYRDLPVFDAKDYPHLLFVCGNMDQEMYSIRQAIGNLGIKYTQALHQQRNVKPSTTYSADSIDMPHFVPKAKHVIMIECDGPVVELFRSKNVIRIGHHRPGDIGWGKPPEQYWQASSIGAVWKMLKLNATEYDLITAACDHCLYEAYGELCGFCSEKILKSRAKLLSRLLRTTPAVVEARVIDESERIKSLEKDKYGIVDLSDEQYNVITSEATSYGQHTVKMKRASGLGVMIIGKKPILEAYQKEHPHWKWSMSGRVLLSLDRDIYEE